MKLHHKLGVIVELLSETVDGGRFDDEIGPLYQLGTLRAELIQITNELYEIKKRVKRSSKVTLKPFIGKPTGKLK